MGLHCDDGNFYPGFFTKKISENDFSEETILDSTTSFSRLKSDDDFVFVARGRIDTTGCYLSYCGKVKKPSHLSFPSLSDLTYNDAILFRPTSSDPEFFKKLPVSSMQGEYVHPKSKKHLNKSMYHFGFQNNIELKVEKIFSSGLWYSTPSVEYFFAGVYDAYDNFKASYAISWDGYFVPGATDQNRRFVPFAKYDEKSQLVYVPLPYMELDQKVAVKRFRSVPKFPSSSELRKKKEWFCMKNGCIKTENTDSITVFSDSALNDKESLNIYIGGNIGPDGMFYFLGKYFENQIFVPGKS